jgi:leucyl-tRNA synthetase
LPRYYVPRNDIGVGPKTIRFLATVSGIIYSARALEDEKVKKFLDGKQVVNIVLVPRKLVNIVVR